MQHQAGTFPETRWSLVHRAGDRRGDALEELCQAYWYPVYAFFRRRSKRVEDAQELTQGLFVLLLSRSGFTALTPEAGRFRSWLLTCARNHWRDEHARATRLKRGGGQAPLSFDWGDAEDRYTREPGDETLSPERLYNRKWTLMVLDRAMDRLRVRYTKNGRLDVFDRFRPALLGDGLERSYAEHAVELGLSESAVKMAVKRLRERYRAEVRGEVADTVDDPDILDNELELLLEGLN